MKILIVSPFRESSERVCEWLRSKKVDILFIDLPMDLEHTIRYYIEGKINEGEFWNDYAKLTGLQEPYMVALNYWLEPTLKFLPELKNHIPWLKVHCYGDFDYHLWARKMSEKLLILAYRSRVAERIDVENWREIFREDHELSELMENNIIENILENIEPDFENVIVYRGIPKNLKQHLKKAGYPVELVYLQRYWRPPLNVLSLLFWFFGEEHVSDDQIEKCVSAHLKYLDFILTEENLDKAHTPWTKHLNLRRLPST